MVGTHRLLNGHEFEQTLGDNERQGSLASCSSWGHKESDTTEQLNNNHHRKWIGRGRRAEVWKPVKRLVWNRWR